MSGSRRSPGPEERETRSCPHCLATVGRFDQICHSCGGDISTEPVAWYVHLLKVVILLLLVWALVDFQDVATAIDALVRVLRPAS